MLESYFKYNVSCMGSIFVGSNREIEELREKATIKEKD
jgi:hypothetical protein